MASESDVARVVSILSAAYPNWNVSPYTVEVYYQDLKDIDAHELEIACQHCRTEAGRKFAPSVGELRGAVMDLRRASLQIPSAYEAWGEVLKAFIEVGHNGSPQWSHPLIAKTVRSLGWRNLCMSEDQTADRARFLQAYEQLTQRAESEMMMVPNVKNYLLENGAEMLALDSIKKLAEGMRK